MYATNPNQEQTHTNKKPSGGSILIALITSQNPTIKNGTEIAALVRKQDQVRP